MRWRLTDETHELLQKLYALEQQRSWFGAQKRYGAISAQLQVIAEKDDVGTITSMAGFLFSKSAEVRVTASRAVAHLISLLAPEDLLHLDEVSDWMWCWQISDVKCQPAMVRSIAVDPAVRTPLLGLVSFHRNGYVRHEAIRLLAEIHDGTELPYLLIRQNDWVEPISRDAQAAVEERLTDDNLVHFVHNISLVAHLSSVRRYDHSQLIHRVVEMLIQPQHERLLLSVIQSPNRNVRRQVMRLALDIETEHRKRVARLGLESHDAILRLWCCRMVRSLFSQHESRIIFQKLKKDRFGPVRSEAYRHEADAFPHEATGIWRDALLDTSHSIRDMAQFYLAKNGVTDCAQVYRDALAHNPNSVSAIWGLGETGNESDLPVMRCYLKSPFPSRRRAAVRGLAQIGGEVATGELIQCLRDDNQGVTRAAVRQLQQPGRVLNGEWLLTVVGDDPRPHCREVALRLIFKMGKWQGVPWLIHAAGYPDHQIAELARQFIETWFTPPLCYRLQRKPWGKQKEVLDLALSQSRASLDPSFQQKLDAWLQAD